jgi:O-antigen ligase/tetratricopeptide (TPR) repeat protein
MNTLKNLLHYSLLTGLFLIPFIPFIVPSAMFFPFITGKGFAFRIIVEIIFSLYVWLCFLDTSYRPKMSWITKSVLLFTATTFIADLFSENVYKSLWSNYERMEGFVLIIHLVMFYFVISSVLKNQIVWKRFFDTTIVASVLTSIYGLLQVSGRLVINQGGDRVDATFGNATYFAIYLVFHIFFCIYQYVQEGTSRTKKIFYGCAGVLDFIILYYTATRGALIGLFGGLGLMALIITLKERENLKLRKYAFTLIAVVLVIVGGLFAFKNTNFVQKNYVLSRFANLSLTEVKTQGRYFVWPMAVKGFLERPVFGWGQESFNYVFNKYYDPRMFGQEQWFDRTHNVFLDWLIAGGLVGFLAYASMYLALFYYVWKKDSVFTLLQKSIISGMIVAYIFHNIFVFDNLVSYILFFVVLAYVHYLNAEKEVTVESMPGKVFSAEITNYIVAPAVIILTVCMVYFVNVPAIKANETLIKAISPQGNIETNYQAFQKVFAYNSFGSTEAIEQLIQVTTSISSPQSQAPANVKQEFYNLAESKIEEKVKETPHDARYLFFAGSFFNRFIQYDKAIDYLTSAVHESPNKQTIYFELGTSYLGKGQITDALKQFKKAYDLEPTSKESQIIYALGGIYSKNAEIQNEMYSKLGQDVIISDDRFIKAYADIGDYSSVIAILTARVQKNPTSIQAKIDLASAYAGIGQKQKAIDIINQVIKDNPDFKTQGESYINQLKSGK